MPERCLSGQDPIDGFVLHTQAHSTLLVATVLVQGRGSQLGTGMSPTVHVTMSQDIFDC